MRLCEFCASTRQTCCQGRDILVTDGDLRRLAMVLGSQSLFEYRAPTDPAYLEQDDDVNWITYTVAEDGARRVLRRKDNGDCLLLGERGCVLAEAFRPLVCRLHPVDYTEAGITGLCPDCPTQGLEQGATVLSAMDMDQRKAESWRRRLYRELRHDAAHGRGAPRMRGKA